jgi:hypothetical protein
MRALGGGCCCRQVEEQTGLLLGLLGVLGEALGTPYAELVWCQVS